MDDENSKRISQEAATLADAGDAVALTLLLETHREQAEDDFELAWNLGWSLVRCGKTRLALELLLRAQSIQPANPIAHWALGMAYRDLGENDNAELSLLRAIALKDSFEPRDELALIYSLNGRNAEAEAILKEGVRLRPNDKDRTEAMQEFIADRR